MNRNCCRMRNWPWVTGLVAAVVLGSLAVATAGLYKLDAKAKQGTAWYSESASPSAAANAATTAPAGKTQPSAAANYANSLSKAFRDAAREVLPSVVMITNRPVVAQSSEQHPAPSGNAEGVPFGFQGTPFGDLFNNPQFHQFFKQMPTPGMSPHAVASAGSGVIVDPSGTILTNNHVVEGGGDITVRLHDGREFKAFDIKTDPMSDLAVIHIKAAGRPANR